MLLFQNPLAGAAVVVMVTLWLYQAFGGIHLEATFVTLHQHAQVIINGQQGGDGSRDSGNLHFLEHLANTDPAEENLPWNASSYYLDWIKRDLEPWAKLGGITREDVQNASYLNWGYCAGDVLRFQILEGRLFVDFKTDRQADGWYPARLGPGNASAKGRVPYILFALLDALRAFPGQIPNVDAVIHTGDFPCIKKRPDIKDYHRPREIDTKNPVLMLGYNSGEDYYDVPFPDYTHYGHEHSVLTDAQGSYLLGWDKQREFLVQKYEGVALSRRVPQAMWRGRTEDSQYPERDRLRRDFLDCPAKLEAAKRASDAKLFNLKEPYVTLAETGDYRYPVYLESAAYTTNLKQKMVCGSPIFTPRMEYYEWWTRALVPGEHYVEVASGEGMCEDVANKVKEMNVLVDDMSRIVGMQQHQQQDAQTAQSRKLLATATEASAKIHSWGSSRMPWEIGQAGRKFLEEHVRMADVRVYIKALLTEYHGLQQFHAWRSEGARCMNWQRMLEEFAIPHHWDVEILKNFYPYVNGTDIYSCDDEEQVPYFWICQAMEAWPGYPQFANERCSGLQMPEAEVMAEYRANPQGALQEPDEDYEDNPVTVPDQWLVRPRRGNLLTVLTAVHLDERSTPLLHNQFRSFATFWEVGTLNEWLLVAPAAQTAKLNKLINVWRKEFPSLRRHKLRVLSDEQCSPQLAPEFLKTTFPYDYASITVPHRQQLLKLACAQFVRTPFYLITNVDLVWLRPVNATDVLLVGPCTNSSAVCNYRRDQSYQARSNLVVARKPREQWDTPADNLLAYTARAISMEVPQPDTAAMGPDPQTFAVPVVTGLTGYVDGTLAGSAAWGEYMLRKLVATFGTPRHGYAWSHSMAYYVYGKAADMYDKFHADIATPQTVVGDTSSFAGWDPCSSDSSTQPLWGMVKAELNISAADIWERLQPCLSNNATHLAGVATMLQAAKAEESSVIEADDTTAAGKGPAATAEQVMATTLGGQIAEPDLGAAASEAEASAGQVAQQQPAVEAEAETSKAVARASGDSEEAEAQAEEENAQPASEAQAAPQQAYSDIGADQEQPTAEAEAAVEQEEEAES